MNELKTEGDVRVLDFPATENRVEPALLDALEAALDEVERAEGPAALVVAGEGKYFSTGLDLEWMEANANGVDELIARLHVVLARLLVAPLPTVAALNGHAYAAGALLAFAFDERVMRADRGFLCLPEVDIGVGLTPGLARLAAVRTTPRVAVGTILQGRRYGGEEAVAAGLAEAAVPLENVRATAVERAAALTGKAGPTLGVVKRNLYADVVEALRGPNPWPAA